MKHDPERNAAAYLGGLLKGARRRMFERHIVDCEDCWREVDLGRKGRSVAEAGRELAPQALRERVRAAVETVQPRRRRPRWVLGTGLVAIVAAAVAVTMAAPGDDPAEIQAALASFRGGIAGAPAESLLPARLPDLELVEANRARLGGIDTVAHRYVNRSGDEVVVYVANEEWPAAVGAQHDDAGETWFAEKGDLVMICLGEPHSALLVGDDVHDVELAAYSLRP